MSPAADPLVSNEPVLPLFAGQGRSQTLPSDRAHSKTRKEPVQNTAASTEERTSQSTEERFQLARYCDCGHWMALMLFGFFLLVDSSKYMADDLGSVRAMGHSPVTAQSIVLLQDILLVVLCLLATLRHLLHLGIRGVVDTFFSMELLRCLPTAVLFSLSNASLAHAIGLGVGAATAVSLGTLYMPMSAFVSRWMFRRAYGWLELHALALLTFSSLTFCELRSRAVGLSGGIRGASFVVLYAALACAACLLAEHILKQRHVSHHQSELYWVQKARFDFWGLLTSAMVLLYLGAPPSPSTFQDWGYLQVTDVVIRVVQSLMAGLVVKYWSTVAKAVTQCCTMLVVFFLGDVVLLGRSQGNVCLYMLALTVALSAFLYQLGRRQTMKQLEANAARQELQEAQEAEEEVEDVVFVSLQRTQSDPTDTRSHGHGGGGARTFLYRAEAERMAPDFQVCCPAEFAPSSQQQLPSLIPQLPAVDGLELLDQNWLEELRTRNSQFVVWMSSKKGVLVQLACVVIFVVFDSARTIVNDQYISGTPIVSQSITFAQFGASIVVGLVVSVAAEGMTGFREALSWKEMALPVRDFAMFPCCYLFLFEPDIHNHGLQLWSQWDGEHGPLAHFIVIGNVYMPLSALLSRWIFRRSYSFLEWVALTVLMLSASAFVLLQNSASGSPSESIFNTGISYVLLSVVMSCLASMLSEKIMKAGNSHFYIQKVNLDVGSFFTSILMLFVCGLTSKRDQDAFWKKRVVEDGRSRASKHFCYSMMEAGIFVAWNWQMIIVLVVTLLQNWLAGFVAKRLSTVIRSSAQQLSLLIVYFVGDLLLNKKGFDWPVGTTALVIALSVQVFVFAGQAAKDSAVNCDSKQSMSTKSQIQIVQLLLHEVSYAGLAFTFCTTLIRWYYCQGGVKTRLLRLGFERVHNENQDFYKVCEAGQVPPFDVLLTNPPFSADEHFSFVLDFAIRSGKPWLMILPVHMIFRNLFVNPTQDLPWRPFVVAPQKKYNFKTPAPLPPPPTENRAKARSRSRLTHTLWVVHGSKGDRFQVPLALLFSFPMRTRNCVKPRIAVISRHCILQIDIDNTCFVSCIAEAVVIFVISSWDQLQEAVQHIEEDLLLAIYAAKCYKLQDACEPTPELLELCHQVSQPECRDDTWDAMMYHRIGQSWKTRRAELIWLDDKVAQVRQTAELLEALDDCEPLHLPLLAHAAADDPVGLEKMKQTLLERLTL
eukprot:s2477_g2.t1